MVAYLGEVSGRMMELMRSAEDPEQSVDRVDFELVDDMLDAQLFPILTMPLKENLTEKVETVKFGDGS